jgi:2-succinyl-5-enolpyruvyl-6-hydroxy-3-cyclohexene-1-carboxylate synthase
MYGWWYGQVQEGDAFGRALAGALAEPRPRLIEVRTDGERDEARRQALVQYVLAALAGSGAN